MQITRQADYALRAMLFLAELDENTRAATSQIAKEKQIPPSFLAKIISQLSIAGIINTSRGARGGVTLARPAEEITLLEVIEAIDGPIALNQCTLSKNGCPFMDTCPIHDVWCEAQAELVKRLSSTNFAQMKSKA
jgi:Rrf2 family protein